MKSLMVAVFLPDSDGLSITTVRKMTFCDRKVTSKHSNDYMCVPYYIIHLEV